MKLTILVSQQNCNVKLKMNGRDGLSHDLDHKSANDFKSFSSLFKSI